MTTITIIIQSEHSPSTTFTHLTDLETDLAIAIIQPKKKPTVFISSLEKKPLRKDLNIKNYEDFKQVVKFVKAQKPTRIGLVYNEVSKKIFDNLKKTFKLPFVDMSEYFLKKREQKNPKEIARIKKAVRITEILFKKLFKKIPSAKTEFELVTWLKKEMLDFGVSPSFEPIIASGKNAQNPHHYPIRGKKLLEGFCVIDMGVKYKGYCSDMTRTIFIGKPTKEQKKFYNEILDELLQLEEKVKSGTKKIKTSFEMIHAVGHGVGRDVHERPNLNIQTLRQKEVIALEPAKYTKNASVRIEDNYLVTQKNIRRLGSLSRKLIILKLSRARV